MPRQLSVSRRASRRCALVLSVAAATAAGTTGLVALGPSAAASGNLVADPGMETGTATMASCWTGTGYGTSTASWSRTSPGHSGTWAQTMTVTSYSSGDRKVLPTMDAGACAPAAIGGQAYTVSEWYRSTAPLRFALYYRGSDGAWRYLASAPAAVAASSAWALATWTTPVLPAGANRLSVGLALASNGSATMDDATVLPVAAPAPTTSTATATVSPTATSTSTATTTATSTPSGTTGTTSTSTATSTSTTFGSTDDFSQYPSGSKITDWTTYASAPFPLGGTSGPANPSRIWEADTGWLLADHGWGWSGRPADWGTVVGDPGDGSSGRYFFRLNTRRKDVVNQDVSWTYKSAPYGAGGYTVASADAVDVWLRYQTQYDTYIVQFDRTNGGFVAKRKVPAQGWSGPSSLIANKGVYYTLQTDSLQPVFGAGQRFISWNGIAPALPAGEKTKPGYPDLAHDGSSTGGTTYAFKATARTLADGSVRLQLFRGGALIGSWTDRNDGIAADGTTLASHLAAGWFNTVPGWQPSWGRPITDGGAAGFRADDIQVWLGGFSLTEGS